MGKLNFYTADFEYVKYLQNAEKENRGFSRIPNMEYTKKHKQKFLCGIVLKVNNVDYYVPVTSYKQNKPDNFLILSDSGKVVSSLRFNYMFPIPKELTEVHIISKEPDRAYRALLAQELRYCIKNQTTIQRLAERTYKRVLLGKDIGLVSNSCDFKLLEQKYHEHDSMKSFILTDTKKDLPCDQLQKLFVSAGWSDGTETPDMVKNYNKNFIASTLIVSAWEGEHLIGAVRVLSDTMFRSIIYDLVVLPEYHSMGIGKKLIEKCIEHYPNSEWLVQTTSEISGYYEKLGFKVNNDVFLTIPCKWFD